MSTLNKLKLVAAKRNTEVNAEQYKRSKLCTRITEQIELATARRDGTAYAPKKLRSVLDAATGVRSRVETDKRVKEWFWTNETGKLNLAVRYGARVLELAKGKNAVEVANLSELVDVLNTVKLAVIAGELDVAITAASSKVRAGFGK